MADTDSLVPLNEAQNDPYKASASDFAVKRVAAGHGQAGDAPGEKNKLVDQSELQESPRENETEGGDRDSMGTRAANVGRNFKVAQSPSRGTSLPVAESVDLAHGDIECGSYKKSPAREVADKLANLG